MIPAFVLVEILLLMSPNVKNDFSDMEDETTSYEVSEVQPAIELYSVRCIEPQGILIEPQGIFRV